MSHEMQDEARRAPQHGQPEPLEMIDKLRTPSVDGRLEPPELLVCGKQFSDKTSILEAISRVRLSTTNDSFYARAATKITLRRNILSKVKVSIDPSPSRKHGQWQELRSFTHESSSTDDLPDLLQKTKLRLGISNIFMADTAAGADVINIEISGPDKPDLTMVDLPGLYYPRASEDPQQRLQGIEDVRGLGKHMEDSWGIILAVISAAMDVYSQQTLDMAKRFDPNGERTLGIITEPDILTENSEQEKACLQFMKNEKAPLKLGWHALCNPSNEGVFEAEKAFFNRGSWASLAHECVGMISLRLRLSSILLEQSRRKLPNLIAETKFNISVREHELSKLGAYRSTIQQQRDSLLSVGEVFEQITGQALNGLYANEFFGGLHEKTNYQDARQLRAVIRRLNEEFADRMAHRGSRRKIVERDNWFGSRAPGMDYVHRDLLETEVREQARALRGIELPGNANQLVVRNLFRDQSKPWEGLAKGHLMQAWNSVRSFAVLVLREIADERTCSRLMSYVIDPELEKLKSGLLGKPAELMAYTERDNMLSVGRGFLSQIQKVRRERQLRLLKVNLEPLSHLKHDGEFVYTMKGIEQAVFTLEPTHDEFAAAEIVDQMQAYYDVRRTFPVAKKASS